MTIPTDNPIDDSLADLLSRAVLANDFADQILSYDYRSGLVVGLLGPWGSGKTSFINLARKEFDKRSIKTLDFNPWMFSGTAGLVGSFFSEIAAQLKVQVDLGCAAKELEAFGDALSGWRRDLVKIVGWLLHGKKSVQERKNLISEKLNKLSNPIVIVLDDIDRLRNSEIRDVFGLVRQTASFPNVIYLLAFDRYRVESALTEENACGRDYLEKILQIAFDLPIADPTILRDQVLDALGMAILETKTGPLDHDRWADIFAKIVLPLIRNIRDIKRYAAAVRMTAQQIEDRVALVDVLGLEAVRVFRPDDFGHICELRRSLHKSGEPLVRRNELQEKIDTLVEQDSWLRDVVSFLFPGALSGQNVTNDAGRWLVQRRVAHRDIFAFYLSRVQSEALSALTSTERAWACLEDESQLEDHLMSLAPDVRESVVATLESYEDQYEVGHVIPATTALLNVLSVTPERPRQFFGFDTHVAFERVVLRLLRVAGDAEGVKGAASIIYSKLRTLYARTILVHKVGYRNGVGHELVSVEAATALEERLRADVVSASVEDLCEEKGLLWTLYFAKYGQDSSKYEVEIPESPRLTLALLQSARKWALSSSGSGEQRLPRLAWDQLADLYGSEETLKTRLIAAKESCLEGAEELFALADKYASGWQPQHFDDE